MIAQVLEPEMPVSITFRCSVLTTRCHSRPFASQFHGTRIFTAGSYSEIPLIILLGRNGQEECPLLGAKIWGRYVLNWGANRPLSRRAANFQCDQAFDWTSLARQALVLLLKGSPQHVRCSPDASRDMGRWVVGRHGAAPIKENHP